MCFLKKKLKKNSWRLFKTRLITFLPLSIQNHEKNVNILAYINKI